jgi:hypothetical protein
MKKLIKIFILPVILMILFATLLFASGIVKIITPPEGSIEIGGPDDTFFIQEISTTDSTIRFKVLDEKSAVALEADFRIITSRQEMYRNISSLNIHQAPYGLRLRGDSIMPIIKVYDGYMKVDIDR